MAVKNQIEKSDSLMSDSEILVSTLASLGKAEFSKMCLIALNGLREASPAVFCVAIFLSSCYLGITLFVLSLVYLLSDNLRAVAVAGSALGAIVIVAVAVLWSLATKEKFWIEKFKMRQMLNDASKKLP